MTRICRRRKQENKTRRRDRNIRPCRTEDVFAALSFRNPFVIRHCRPSALLGCKGALSVTRSTNNLVAGGKWKWRKVVQAGLR